VQRELALRGRELGLALLAGGRVRDHRDEIPWRPSLVTNQRNRVVDPDDSAVLAKEPTFRAEGPKPPAIDLATFDAAASRSSGWDSCWACIPISSSAG
jgi:hypothetical protein